MGPAVKTFLILGKEEGFMPARSLLRPWGRGEKDRIETEQEGGDDLGRQGGRQQGQRCTRESQASITQWGPAALIYLSHHDSWVPGGFLFSRGAHKPS